jgi:hypothetical protein
MGNNCPAPAPDPVTTNHCNDYFNDAENNYYNMKDFCSAAGSIGDPYRETWCEKLGSTGEWNQLPINDSNDPVTCTYNDCYPYKVDPRPCCGGCCPIIGNVNICARRGFNGNPIKCCLQDKVCTNPGHGNPQLHTDAPASCFSDIAKKDTCAPCHRDVTSTSRSLPDDSFFTCQDKGLAPCRTLVSDYCAGNDLPLGSSEEWFSRWFNPATGEETPQSCVNALKRNLFSIGTIGCAARDIPLTNGAGLCTPVNFPISADGEIWSRDLMQRVFTRYSKEGFVLGTNPGSVGYSTFQDFLYEIGCAVPVVMQDSLKTTCAIYTDQSLSRDPTIANFCGCYLPDIQYEKYVNDYQVNKECTPMCNRETSIPLITGDNQPFRCNQTSCIIDDIAINLISSNVGQSGIGVSQICGNCAATGIGTASCNCVISSDVIDAVNANIGGINISEQCSSSVCSVKNPDPNGTPPTVQIPCSEVSDPNAFNNEVNAIRVALARVKQQRIMVAIFLVLLLLVFIWLALTLTGGRRRR